MDVKVRHALADLVVHGDERPLGPDRPLDRLSQPLGVPEQGMDQMIGEIGEGLVMLAGDQKDMAGKEGTVVEEGDGALVFHDDGGA